MMLSTAVVKPDGEKGEELPGAKLEVRDSTGKVIDSWTSGITIM
jgi:hypothetical protein